MVAFGLWVPQGRRFREKGLASIYVDYAPRQSSTAVFNAWGFFMNLNLPASNVRLLTPGIFQLTQQEDGKRSGKKQRKASQVF